jgi:Leucine-rich repeat (LRR) protein
VGKFWLRETNAENVMPKKQKAGRLPSLGKLSVAVLEHLVQPVIGENAIRVVKAPLLDKELRDSLIESLVITEENFLAECPDPEVCKAILDLPLADSPEVIQAVRDFYARPTETALSQILYEQTAAAYPDLAPERIRSGLRIYIKALRYELIYLDREIREKLAAVAALGIEENTSRMVDVLERLDQRLDPNRGSVTLKASGAAGLELVDVSFVEGNKNPTLDIKLRNTAKQIAFLKRAAFAVQAVWNIHPTYMSMGVVKSSAQYDVVLPAKDVPYTEFINLSQAIRQNSVDRFQITLKIDSDKIYLVSLKLIYDGDDKFLDCGPLLLFKSGPNSYYSLSRYENGLDEDSYDSLRDVRSIYKNKLVLDEVRLISAVRNPECSEIEQYIQDCSPYLEAVLSAYRQKLINLTDGTPESQAAIEPLLNPDYEIKLRDFRLSSSDISNEILPYLKSLTKLQELYLFFNSKLVDDGLKSIGQLVDLRWLDLGFTAITDAGLAHLQTLQALEHLALRQNENQRCRSDLSRCSEKFGLFEFVQVPITDAGIVHLQNLTKLESLVLGSTKVSDAGLAHLQGLKNLKDLDLSSTMVSDAGLVYLQSLKNLEGLDLRSTKVSDAGLVYLQDLKMLKVLNLDSTQVTDQGLAYLSELTALEKLNLADCKVTVTGLEPLRNLPNLTVRLETGYDRWKSVDEWIKTQK